MRALGRFVIDADLAKADPAREPLEEAVALRHLAQRGGRARREQAEVAGVLGDLVARAPVDQRVERLPPGAAAQTRSRVRLGGVDHVVAVIEPMPDERAIRSADAGRRRP